MANQSASPFKGAGVFTTRSPSSANSVPANWIALEAKNSDSGMLEGGDSAVQAAKNVHSKGGKAFAWAGSVLDKNVTTADQDAWNKGAIAAAQKNGLDGVILSGETPLEMESAQRFAAQALDAGLKVAIVGNPGLVAPGKWDPRVTAMPEAYLNANEYNSPVTSVATSQRAGATDIVPIYGIYNDGGVHSVIRFSDYDAQAQKAGIGNFGVFNAETLITNSNDVQAFGAAASRTGATSPLPQLGGPRPATPVFGGLTTFTAGSPSFGLPLAGSVDGMAIKASGSDATPEAIGTFNNAGVRTYAWAQPVTGDYDGQVSSNNQAAAAASQQGAKGLILPGMDDAQIRAAQAVAANSHIPVAIITNAANLSKVPAGTTAMLLGDGLSPDQLAAAAKSRPNTVPIIAAYDATNQNNLLGQYLTKAGPSVGIFTLDSARYSQTNLNSLLDYIINRSTGKLPGTSTAGSAGGSGVTAVHSGNSGNHTQSNRKPKIVNTRTAVKKTIPKYPGITGPHQAAGADGAPKAYTGGAAVVNDPKQTFSFTDKVGRRVTITTTASGAKIEQVAGHTPYNIKRATAAPARTPITDASKPAWHQNTAWAAPAADTAAKARVDANTVLEQRPGANGNTILRMADGTYKSYNPNTGQTTGAGTWNKDQWDSTHHGQQVAGGGGSSSSASGSNSSDSNQPAINNGPPSNDKFINENAPITDTPPIKPSLDHVWTQEDQNRAVLNRGINGPTGPTAASNVSSGPVDPYGTPTFSNDQRPDTGVTGLVGDSTASGRGGV